MEASAALSSGGRIPVLKHPYSCTHRLSNATNSRALLVQSMATKKSKTSSTKNTISSRRAETVFPLGEPGPRPGTTVVKPPVKLLTRVEQLRLLTKAEKAGLLSAAEKAGLSLGTIEQLGLLSKAEELGVLSAATNPATPSALSTLSWALLLLGPAFVLVVPEEYPWETALQVAVALVCVVGGSAAFAAANLVSNLQKAK